MTVLYPWFSINSCKLPNCTCSSLECISSLQIGMKAPQAAGRIHTDFEKGFIMAEVMKFVDFKEHGSENATKVRFGIEIDFSSSVFL